MFDNINMKDVIEKAKEMQDQFQQMRDQFTNKELQGMAGVDDEDKIYVRGTIDGARMLKSLEIGSGAKEQDVDVLSDLIILAINNATEKLNDEMKNQVQSIYQSNDLPSNPADESEKQED